MRAAGHLLTPSRVSSVTPLSQPRSRDSSGRSNCGTVDRVGINATQDEADTAFARQIVDHVRAHVTSGIYKPNGRGGVLQDLVDHMLTTGAAPDMDTLEGIEGKALPASVYGPDVTLLPITLAIS